MIGARHGGEALELLKTLQPPRPPRSEHATLRARRQSQLTGADLGAAVSEARASPKNRGDHPDLAVLRRDAPYFNISMLAKSLSYACAALLLFGCGRDSKRSAPSSALPAEAEPQPRTPQTPQLAPPTRLTSLPISAYAASLALDDDAVYLLTSHAAYRLVAGQPARGIRLELGIGATLTQSAFVFRAASSVPAWKVCSKSRKRRANRPCSCTTVPARSRASAPTRRSWPGPSTSAKISSPWTCCRYRGRALSRR